MSNFLELNAFKPAIFNINGETREMSIKELIKFKDFISKHLLSLEEVSYYIEYWKELPYRLESFLERNFIEEENWYNLSYDYYTISGLKKSDFIDEFEKLIDDLNIDKKNVDIDSTSSFFHLYVLNKEDSEKIIMEIWNRWVKNFLDEWSVGYEEFKKDTL